MARGLTVGLVVLAVTAGFVDLPLASPAWIVVFALAGSAILGALGLVAGIWADKFDQIAAFQNFIILPLTFLSGVFYSIHSLPPFWQRLSHLNPFFYMIDGFRYGFFGTSDFPPQASLAVVGLSLLGLTAVGLGCSSRLQACGVDMVTTESVKAGIQAGLACEHLEVAGDGQHFQALIVSREFEGRSRVQRHQLVYAALGERMREEIHALSMKTLTPQEWRADG
jgi:acid stress-induced BolA-like protein IbaG/YrbA